MPSKIDKFELLNIFMTTPLFENPIGGDIFRYADCLPIEPHEETKLVPLCAGQLPRSPTTLQHFITE